MTSEPGSITKARHSRLLTAAAAASAMLIGIQILRWPLISAISVFLEPVLEMAVDLVFLAIAVICIISAIRTRKHIARSTWSANVICLVTAGIVLTVPFTWLYLKVNFRLFESRRTVAARQILLSTADPASAGKISFLSIPDAGDITDAGEIAIDRTNGKPFVLFFTYRGILERFSGFVYSPTGEPPPATEFGGDGREIERLGPKWFWYSS